jgi:hypothetical protein
VRKVLVYSEGPTEERFVKSLLVPHLLNFDVAAQPVIATTKVVKSGPNFKGGIGTYSRTRRELLHLLGDSSAHTVTTMVDYYGLDRSFPGREHPQGANAHERVMFVENEILRDIDDPRFLPFLTLHEFEALLFASPEGMAEALPGGQSLGQRFRRIRDEFQTPEEIDDDIPTAPHRRILGLYTQYHKPLHGTMIASRIGLDVIRRECPHFNAWVTALEGAGRRQIEGGG